MTVTIRTGKKWKIVLLILAIGIPLYFVFSPDWDLDGVANTNDLCIFGDAAINVGASEIIFEDPVDGPYAGDGDGWINVTYFATEPSYNQEYSGISEPKQWLGQYNLPDDKNHGPVWIRIALWDEDGVVNDLCDISIVGNCLDIIYDPASNTWTGEDNDGFSNGSTDGSAGFDEDDAAIHYSITVEFGGLWGIDLKTLLTLFTASIAFALPLLAVWHHIRKLHHG